jgi:hypothetical protein
MKKESLSEAGYLVLTIVITFIVLIGIAKNANAASDCILRKKMYININK